MVDVAGVIASSNIAHFSGVWAIAVDRFDAMLAAVRVQGEDNAKRLAAQVSCAEQGHLISAFEVLPGGTARIDISGVTTKHGFFWDGPIGGTTGVRLALEAVAERGDVERILLVIDSPGGSVGGLDDLARDVAATAERMPVVAYLEDLAASAAYYVASQATRVIANPSALIGSIGSYMAVTDWSGFFAAAGVKRIVIRSGELKGAGVMGTEISAEQQEEFQRIVDAFGALFVEAVARGRGLPVNTVRDLADGRVHIASEALALGMIDEIADLDAAVEKLSAMGTRDIGRARLSSRPTSENANMTDNKATEKAPPVAAKVIEGTHITMTEEVRTAAPPAATAAELKAAFPGADAEFRLKCIETGLTLPQATAEWSKALESRLKSKDAELTKLKGAQECPGVEAIGSDAKEGVGGGTATEQWEAAVNTKLTQAGMTKGKAYRQLAHEQPELMAAWEAEFNEAVGRGERPGVRGD